MKWGIRAQILVALVAIVGFGLSVSFLVTSQVTDNAVFDARVERSRSVGHVIAGQLRGALRDGAGGAALQAALAEARALVAPDRLWLVTPAGEPWNYGANAAADPLPADLTSAAVQRLAREPGQHVVVQVADAVDTLVVAADLGPTPSKGAASAQGHANRPRLTLLVVSDLSATTTRRGVLVRLLGFFTLMIVALALVLGYFLLGRLVIRPLQTLARPVERIGAGEFAQADTLHASSKEMLQLYQAFNRMSAQLARDRAKIQAQVHELTLKNRDLDAAQQQLVVHEKLATVGTLAAGVAHEIGNPIAVLQGYLELLGDDDLDEAVAARYRSAMNDAVRRISTIITDLLDFARPVDLDDRVCDAAAVVTASAQLVEPQPRFRHVSLSVDVPSAGVLVAFNAGRLEQVLLNLLFNAADASPDGATVKLAVTVDDDPERPVCLTVSDEGPGISGDVLRQMFDPFFTTKEPGEGTGLGLAICHNIVASYGGRIYAEVPDSGGTIFTVRLGIPESSQSVEGEPAHQS